MLDLKYHQCFEVYKGVLPEYAEMIEHVTTGPVIAIEVREEDVVTKIRALVGPHDPDLAKNLRPNTIRALFGRDRVHNAVHCTDLQDDGKLEVDYFFNQLANNESLPDKYKDHYLIGEYKRI